MTQFNDKKNDAHGWNKRRNKKDWGLYILVGLICIILGWLLGSTGK